MLANIDPPIQLAYFRCESMMTSIGASSTLCSSSACILVFKPRNNDDPPLRMTFEYKSGCKSASHCPILSNIQSVIFCTLLLLLSLPFKIDGLKNASGTLYLQVLKKAKILMILLHYYLEVYIGYPVHADARWLMNLSTS